LRNCTKIFKSIIGLGAEPKASVLSMWGTVKRAAEAAAVNHAERATVAMAVAFIDKLVGVVADLPKPDDADQQDLPEAAKPADAKPPGDPPGRDINEGNRG
jgi:hypothetical protein